MCVQGTCDISGPSGVCTECVVKLLEVFHTNNITADMLFNETFVQMAIRNGTLPFGSRLQDLNGEGRAIFLPDSFSKQCNKSCTPLVIIDQAQELEYEILGMKNSPNLTTKCIYTFVIIISK